MKLSYGFALASIGAVAVAGVFGFGGCSSGGSTPGPAGSSGAAPLPSVPTGGTPASSTLHNFAVNNLFLGDTANGDVNFLPSKDGWKSIGFDLDGINTVSGTATDVCKPPSGLPVMVDGTAGIDNAFGEKITGIINTVLTGPSKQISQTYIQTNGTFTVMMDFAGIDPTNKTDTITGITTSIFAGGTYDGGMPIFSGSPSLGTNWPVEPSLLSSTTPPLTSKVQISGGAISGGNFVAVGSSVLSLSLAISGVDLQLDIHKPVITFSLAADGSIKNGIIGGILQASQLKSTLSSAVTAIGGSASLCNVVPTLLASIDKASDIMLSGDPGAGQTCDGLSIGLGFTAVEIAQPTNLAAGTTSTSDGGGCTTTDGG